MAAVFYYNLEQMLLQIGTASLLQIEASDVTNWGSYHKLWQLLLQNRAAITNWGKIFLKLRQVLQIRAIITNLGITNGFYFQYLFFLTKYHEVPRRKVKQNCD